MRWLLYAALTLWFTVSEARALEAPPLTAQVNDLAGMIDAAHRQALESKLAAYERSTGHQFVVLTVPSLEGDVIEDFGVRVFEQWKLGDAKREDGLLLVVALEDRKTRIEVGYGLEGAVTDLFSVQVLRDVLRPALREGRFEEGLEQTLDLLMAKAEGVEVGVPKPRERRGSSASAGFVVFLVIMILLFSRFGGGGGGGRRRG
ncbi:MAG: TPM domain-containing protein, partial [Polyangiales bacterium]